jgi:hypothetical protein
VLRPQTEFVWEVSFSECGFHRRVRIGPHSDNPVSQELGGQLKLVDLGKDFSRGNERLQECRTGNWARTLPCLSLKGYSKLGVHFF